MRYLEKKADVTQFDTRVVICHCISVDCAMGAGVVIPIMKKHPMLKPYCKGYVKEMTPEKALGTAYRFEDEDGVCYNLFSKMSVKNNAMKIGEKAYLKILKNCLLDLRDQMIFYREKFLAMPKIASGLDKCDWDNVRNLIQEVFADTDIAILICLWP